MDHSQVVNDYIYNKGYLEKMLFLAIQNNDLPLADSLLHQIDDPAIRSDYAYRAIKFIINDNKHSPLPFQIPRKYPQEHLIGAIQFLMQFNPDLNQELNAGQGELIQMINSDDDLDVIKLLIQHGANPNLLNAKSKRLLYTLIENYYFKEPINIIRHFLEKGLVDVNGPLDEHGHSPLAVAVMFNRSSLVTLFLEFGARVDLTYTHWLRIEEGDIMGQTMIISEDIQTEPMTILEFARHMVSEQFGNQNIVKLLDDHVEKQPKGVNGLMNWVHRLMN